MYCIWLLSSYSGRVAAKTMWPGKPKIFTIHRKSSPTPDPKDH